MTKDTLSDMGGRMRDRIRDVRTDRLERDNDRLRSEVGQLRTRLDAERDERADLLDTMRSIAKRRPKRRIGLMRMLILGGGAYVLGARAGRERYEEIAAKARELWSKARQETGASPAGATQSDTPQSGITSTSVTPARGTNVPAGDVRVP